MPASRAQIISADIRNINGFVLGLATYGQQLNAHRYESSSLYANVLGNVDTTNGYALKVQYGDPDGSPVTIASFAKAGITLGAPGDALEDLWASYLTPAAGAQTDRLSISRGTESGTRGVSTLTSDTVNFGTPALVVQSRIIANQYSLGQLPADVYIESQRYGKEVVATATVTGTSSGAATFVDTDAGFVAAGVAVDDELYIATGTQAGVHARITAVTNLTTLAISPPWTGLPPTAGDTYTIQRGGAPQTIGLLVNAMSSGTSKPIGTYQGQEHIAIMGYARRAAGTAGMYAGLFLADSIGSGGHAIGVEIDLGNFTGAQAPTAASGTEANRSFGLNIRLDGGGSPSLYHTAAIYVQSTGADSAAKDGMYWAANTVFPTGAVINYAAVVSTAYRTRDHIAFSHVARNGANNADVVWLNWASDALTVGNGNGTYALGATGAVAGITISQLTNDDNIIQFQSSDVAHGVTDVATTATYGFAKKFSATEGGLHMTGLADAGAVGLYLRGVCVTANTGKNATSTGAIVMDAALKSGTGVTNLGAEGNLFVIQNNDAGAASGTVLIVDAEGDILTEGAASTYDAWDDIALCRALDYATNPAGVIAGEFDQFLHHNMDDLVRAGILHRPARPGGKPFVSWTRLAKLHNGAVHQMATRLRRLEDRLAALAPGYRND